MDLHFSYPTKRNTNEFFFIFLGNNIMQTTLEDIQDIIIYQKYGSKRVPHKRELIGLHVFQKSLYSMCFFRRYIKICNSTPIQVERFICNAPHFSYPFKWDTLENRRLLAQATMFYKIINGIVNISIPHRLTPNPRPGRGSHHLRYHQVITNLNIYKYSFYPRVIPLWNILPPAAVTAPSHQVFCPVALPAIRCLPPATSSYGW